MPSLAATMDRLPSHSLMVFYHTMLHLIECLHLFEWFLLLDRVAAVDVIGHDDIAITEDDGFLDGMLQLSDIAIPR